MTMLLTFLFIIGRVYKKVLEYSLSYSNSKIFSLHSPKLMYAIASGYVRKRSEQ